MKHRSFARRAVSKQIQMWVGGCALFFLLLSLTGCGDTQQQQQASKNLQALNTAITQAQNIGVPAKLMQTILQQERDLENMYAPLFDADTYYKNLALRYAQLTIQVNGLEIKATESIDYQATQDLQTMSNALAERKSQEFVEAATFADMLSGYQQAMTSAQYP